MNKAVLLFQLDMPKRLTKNTSSMLIDPCCYACKRYGDERNLLDQLNMLYVHFCPLPHQVNAIVSIASQESKSRKRGRCQQIHPLQGTFMTRSS